MFMPAAATFGRWSYASRRFAAHVLDNPHLTVPVIQRAQVQATLEQGVGQKAIYREILFGIHCYLGV
jgi:hypothetical protein